VVRLHVHPDKVGHEYRVVRSNALSLAVELWQENEKLGTNESSRTEEYTQTVRVLGLVGGTATKLRVHYERYALDEKPTVGDARSTRFLEGKTFVVDANDGKPTFTREDGKPVSEEEQKELARLHADVGEPDALVTALGEGAMGVGASGKITDKLLSALLGTGAGKLQDGTISLTGVRADNGRQLADIDFDATTKTEEENGLEITSRLKGHAAVALEPAEVVSVTYAGSMDAGGRTRNERGFVDLHGAGSTKDSRAISAP
jgi:hypothetical protein